MVKNLPCNAGLIPGRGTKIPHAVEQLSPPTTIRIQVPQPHGTMKRLRATIKTRDSQINKYFKNWYNSNVFPTELRKLHEKVCVEC